MLGIRSMLAKKPANLAIRVGAFALLTGPLCACTTLGPMPAMTGVPTVPLERPGIELQGALVPGYYLSSTATEKPKATQLPQLVGVFEPDELLHVPGLFAGARYAGDSSSGAALEPLLGYRTFLDDEQRLSLAAVGFAAYASAEKAGASFTALRGGLEAGVDARLTPTSHYAELHANLGATVTALSADGQYCVDDDRRYGIDCPSDGSRLPISASVSGIFPSGHAGLSLDFGRHLHAPFHGVRVALDAAGGSLPTLIDGQEQGAKLFGSGGLSVTLGLGANGRRAAPPANAP
jgi:hypothetical protein